MAYTEIYVDPSIAADSGAGTVGDPYGDLEHAIVQTTFDTTNGTRVNIKAGTDEVLVADLLTSLDDTSVSIAWAVPGPQAPFVFQGYSTAAGDGGIGGISGGGAVSIFNKATQDFIVFRDLHLHNTGANNILTFDDKCRVENCELNNTSAKAIDCDSLNMIFRNYIHDIGAEGIISNFGADNFIAWNYLKNGTKSFTTAIDIIGGMTFSNIISLSGTSVGISLGNASSAISNSIYGGGGSGKGVTGRTSSQINSVINNLVTDFSASGGFGIHMSNATVTLQTWGANSFYNNDTDVTAISNGQPILLTANETLVASPFTDAAGGDFSPVDTGTVKEGSYPQTFYEGV